MSEKKKKTKTKRSSIGGQAVLEGVMMMGSTCMATAVRDPEGEIQVEARRINRSPKTAKACKIPFVRGIVNMFGSLVRGTGALMRSAEVYGDEEEAGNLEKVLAEKFKINLMSVVSVVSVCLGVALAVALFLVLPNLIVSGLKSLFPSLTGSVWEYIILGVIKLVIYFAYLGIILLLKDIRRLYMYHGAEHKTITCYEKGLELTPENARGCSRLHSRCGTSFLFIVLAINILIISLVNWGLGVAEIESNLLQFLAKLGIEIVLLPVITGVSYEILKFLAKFDNWFVNIFKAPGYFMQKVFTTREPTDDMLEVAIAAFKKALEMDADPDMEETEFVTGGMLTQKLKATKEKFAKKDIDESDAEWIYSLVLDIPRSELTSERIISPAEVKAVKEIVDKRLTGRPLWYIIGDVDFCGCKIKVDERVLIPRPETEQLADIAIKTVEEGDKVLDMCTGSGCIAIAMAKGCAGKHISVTAADVSDAALMVARQNAVDNEAVVHFVQSDLFDGVRGRFNVIVCNPPYIKSSDIHTLQKEVRDYEPRIALDGGDDGLDIYRSIAKVINRYIARGGMLILECGEGQADEILKIFSRRDYAMVIKDLYGVDRFLKIAF
ncbi:MAG: peptide chain release factor N(5)-glutamine methyltransferase [Clostridia bacterium]|nr:peptide chain release factor N(5)-glutamine methyltransferase [Clostridia bacterium]